MEKASQVKKVNLTWKSLTATVKDKAILNDCEGYCRGGEMLAIMGPSGAGKTTLLSLLSQKGSRSLNVSGDILANGQKISRKTFYNFGTFVYQNDLLFSTLTVRETLEFAAFLKIADKQEALATVNDLLTSFELQKCENTYIGDSIIKGISGGEKKRVCVAIEMVSRPSLIILDEPTSGLDSNKAAKLLSILKKLAEKGHTIIFTLHQPSYLQYIKLDRLILLNRGQTVYQGKASEICGYMEKVGIRVDTKATISDFFMMEISESKRLADDYETPLNGVNYEKHLADGVHENIDEINNDTGDLHISNIFQASFWFSFVMLLKRDWTIFWRDRMKFGVCLMNTVMRFLLVGILFRDVIPSRQIIYFLPVQAFIGIQGLAFNCAASTVMPSINVVTLALPLERQLFFKENDSKKYNALPYFLSKIVILYFGTFTSSILYCLSAYWLNGWTNTFPYFINFVCIVSVLTLAGCSLGIFCSTLFKEPGRVAAMTNIVLIPLMIVGGLFNKLDAIPVYIRWLQYLSPFRYGLQLFLENEYRDQIFGTYDYRKDLGYTLSYQSNLWLLTGVSFMFMAASFLFLKRNTDKLVA